MAESNIDNLFLVDDESSFLVKFENNQTGGKRERVLKKVLKRKLLEKKVQEKKS